MRPCLRSRRDREALLKVRERSGSPTGGPVGVGRPSWRSGKGQEALTKVREALSEVWEGSGILPRGPQ